MQPWDNNHCIWCKEQKELHEYAPGRDPFLDGVKCHSCAEKHEYDVLTTLVLEVFDIELTETILTHIKEFYGNWCHHDIVWLSAQPLLKAGNSRVLGDINIYGWEERMQDVMRSQSARIRYARGIATKDNLEAMCKAGTKILSFIMHGIKLTDEISMEHPEMPGLSKYYSIQEIQPILEMSDSLELVFIISKHAQSLVSFFNNCGVRHVVGAKYDYDCNMDERVARFHEHFFNAILKGDTVANAFNNAQASISDMVFNAYANFCFRESKESIMERFSLAGSCPENHSVPVFEIDLENGAFIDKSGQGGNFRMPHPIQNFTGRFKSLCELLTDLQESGTLCLLYGPEGFGKTALATMVANYSRLRKTYENIYYVDFDDSPLTNIVEVIAHALQNHPYEKPEEAYYNSDAGTPNSDAAHSSIQERLIHVVSTPDRDTILPNEEDLSIRNIRELSRALSKIPGQTLLILDSIWNDERFAVNNVMALEIFEQLIKLLDKTPRLRVLVCSRMFHPALLELRRLRWQRNSLKIEIKCIKPLNPLAANRVLTESIHPSIWKREFPSLPSNYYPLIMKQHPLGHLAKVYFSPLAMKRLAYRVNALNSLHVDMELHLPEFLADVIVYAPILHGAASEFFKSESQRKSWERNNWKLPERNLKEFQGLALWKELVEQCRMIYQSYIGDRSSNR